MTGGPQPEIVCLTIEVIFVLAKPEEAEVSHAVLRPLGRILLTNGQVPG